MDTDNREAGPVTDEEQTDADMAADIENLRRFYPSCTDEELKEMAIKLRAQYPTFGEAGK